MKPLHIALTLLLVAAIAAYFTRDKWSAYPKVGYSEPTIIERSL